MELEAPNNKDFSKKEQKLIEKAYSSWRKMNSALLKKILVESE